jgi:hypothetical protein
VGVYHVKGVVGERQLLSVRDPELAAEALLGEVRPGQLDCGRSQVHARDASAALRKSRQVDGGATSDFEDLLAAMGVELDEAQQVMKLLEMVVIEIVKESARSDGMPCDLEIVNVLFPIGPNFVGRGHV